MLSSPKSVVASGATHESLRRRQNMYVVVEFRGEPREDELRGETDVRIVGMQRRVKAASVDAWRLVYEERLTLLDDYMDKDRPKPQPRRYGIMCWDDRPEENVLLGCWRLQSPPLERGKVKAEQRENVQRNVEENLASLRAGVVPSALWNRWMTFHGVPKLDVQSADTDSA